jgi:hypothetical protein
MTITISTMVTNSMRRINMLAAGQDADAAEADEVLGILNDMMLALPAKGVHTGWTTLALTDNFPLEDRHIEGVTWMLSEAITGGSGMSLSAEQQKKANAGWLALEADYKILERLRVDTGLSGLPSQRLWGY